ncbi:MAG: tetratricopeptide repeat protein [Candidatus Aquicultorales bacterium]
MLLDKRRASTGIKMFAILIAISFLASMALFVVPSTAPVTTNPQNFQEFVQAGNSYQDQKQYGKAVEMYTKALEKDPKNVDVRTDLAIAYFYSNKPQDAIKQALEGIKYNPNHPKVHYNLGIFYQSVGNNAEAKKELEAYLKLEPNGDSASQAQQILASLGK